MGGFAAKPGIARSKRELELRDEKATWPGLPLAHSCGDARRCRWLQFSETIRSSNALGTRSAWRRDTKRSCSMASGSARGARESVQQDMPALLPGKAVQTFAIGIVVGRVETGEIVDGRNGAVAQRLHGLILVIAIAGPERQPVDSSLE